MKNTKTRALIGTLLLAGFGLLMAQRSQPVAAAFQTVTLTVVSAASYESNCAPESIGAVFGNQLAAQTLVARDADPQTPGVQLPTTLGGTSVEIAGRLTGLFFVSPGQVNFLLPANLPVGSAEVIVRSNGGAQTGSVNLAATAPGLFTVNGNGQGVIAGSVLRVSGGTLSYEDVAQYTGEGFIPRPIELGGANDELYLILYGTGWRQGGNETRVVLGGETIVPLYVGPQPGALGGDQINVLIPPTLTGRGRLTVAVVTPDTTSSNVGEIEIAGRVTANAPTVSAVAPAVTQAAQTVTIDGSGFAANLNDNQVRIGNVEAQVISATNAQIVARVPFGSDSGKVLVRTGNGDGVSDNNIRIRTSMSGLVESTDRQPLPNMTISALNGFQLIRATTGASGTFVLSEFTAPQSGSAFVTIDGSRVPSSPTFGKLTLNQAFLNGRDSQFGNPLTLQQVTGASTQVGGGRLEGENNEEPYTINEPIYQESANAPNEVIESGSVRFELPRDTEVRFPDGATSGLISLTVVQRAQLPVRWPTGLWTSTVVQLTPFGTQFSKGGRFRFPNPEKYPAGSRLIICQLDQGEKSANLGQWIAPGNASVTSDGLFIETDPDTIKQGTYYFVAGVRPLTTVTGRVVEANGTPVRRARVRIHGQETLTDGNGGFVIRNVTSGGAEDLLVVEAAATRANGRVDYADSKATAPVLKGLTNVGNIVLPDPASNQSPSLVAASTYNAIAGQQTDYEIYAYDFEDGSTPNVSVSGLSFAAIVTGSSSFGPSTQAGVEETAQTTATILRFNPPASQAAGIYPFTITATDKSGGVTSRLANVVIGAGNNRAPVASNDALVASADALLDFTLRASDPDNDALTYEIIAVPRNGTLTGIAPRLIYRPNAGFTGADSFTFRASDGSLTSNLATVSLTVTLNRPPVLTVPGAQTVNAGGNVSFTISATDPDAGQTITYAATALPAGATFNSATRAFLWAVPTTASGAYTATFTATDSGNPARSDTKSVTITVTNSSAPSLFVPGMQTAAAGDTVSFTLLASAPNPGQTLVFSASSLPTGATFNATTRRFMWTIPLTAAAGSYTISFKVADRDNPLLSDTQFVTIKVAASSNLPPVLTVPGTQSVLAGNTVSFTISATDPDASQTLTYAATTLPSGASFNPATRTFNWTTLPSHVGTHTATFTVTDNGSPVRSDTKSVTITVIANSPPVLTVQGGLSKSVNDNELLSFSISATDPDLSQTLTYAATGLPSGASFNPATRTFNWTPNSAQVGGPYTVTFTVTDNGSPQLSDTKSVMINVTMTGFFGAFAPTSKKPPKQ